MSASANVSVGQSANNLVASIQFFETCVFYLFICLALTLFWQPETGSEKLFFSGELMREELRSVILASSHNLMKSKEKKQMVRKENTF